MHWDIVVNCVINPKKWEMIPLPHNKDLSRGTGFERALHDAGKALSKLAKTEGEVTFWIRGDVMLVTENGGLKTLPQNGNPVEFMAKMEGGPEKCFKVHEVTGESEWIDCLPDC